MPPNPPELNPEEIEKLLANCRTIHLKEIKGLEEVVIRLSDTATLNKITMDRIESTISDIRGSILGDTWHPNGLERKVTIINSRVLALETEWGTFKAGIKGWAFGIAMGAGLAGGGIVSVISKVIT